MPNTIDLVLVGAGRHDTDETVSWPVGPDRQPPGKITYNRERSSAIFGWTGARDPLNRPVYRRIDLMGRLAHGRRGRITDVDDSGHTIR